MNIRKTIGTGLTLIALGLSGCGSEVAAYNDYVCTPKNSVYITPGPSFIVAKSGDKVIEGFSEYLDSDGQRYGRLIYKNVDRDEANEVLKGCNEALASLKE